MPGAQAEYLRIAMADASLFPMPGGIKKELGLMMCDILPTGYSVAMNAWRLADEDRERGGGGGGLAGEGKGEGKKGICVVVGCGPVGLCAITSAKTMFEKVFATDLAPHRLVAAEKHGAIALPKAELLVAVSETTNGRGADAVLELVGHEAALLTAIELARPYGVISVGGVHHAPLSLNGGTLYDKNLRFQFGRCSVRSFFDPALQVLRANQELFDGFVEHVVEWDQAEEYYALFERNKVGKTAFMAYGG
ncbi:MAG: hypothetical protein TREMPRED_001826 [Tremellales sp. Tagirdzhanova-0007]|nr:MAG: hypothetical protein TREMPRED_001826 [Tremellales sp. Tagirdzhanova-0007]